MKILYLITEDWFFCSHFIERAVAAKRAGYDVTVIAREGRHGSVIREAGLRFIPLEFRRNSLSIAYELRTLWSIFRIYRRERPDIVHHVASKPILYGSLVARFLSGIAVVNAPVGMGYIFSSSDRTARLLRPLVRLAYRLLLNPPRSKVVFENSEDLAAAVESKAVRRGDAELIRGAGVNVDGFPPRRRDEGPPKVVLVARMLKDKGIVEFVEAARLLANRAVDARMVLVGDPDPANPASLSEQQLAEWNGRWGIEWLGWRSDIPAILASADIGCLPSYREGLPKSLIEAASAGLAIVTTDTVGCREVVVDGVTGLLVPVRDSAALADALQTMIEDEGLRNSMGEAGRALARAEFSSERIIAETLAIYAGWGDAPQVPNAEGFAT